MRLEHLSATRLSTYLMCPMKYRLNYIDKVEWAFTPISMKLGIVIHEVLEAFYRGQQAGLTLEFDPMQMLFDDIWGGAIDGVKLDVADPTELYDLGIRLLKTFSESVTPQEVIAIEEPFSVPLIDPNSGEVLPVELVGRWDLVEADEAGTITIVDHKTLAKRPSNSELERNIQLSAYAYAARVKGRVRPNETVPLRVDCLIKTKNPVFEQRFTLRTPKQEKGFLSLCADVVHAIEQEAFPANPGWQCETCPVKRHCYI